MCDITRASDGAALRVTSLVQVMVHIHMCDITIASDSARVTLLVRVMLLIHV